MHRRLVAPLSGIFVLMSGVPASAGQAPKSGFRARYPDQPP